MVEISSELRPLAFEGFIAHLRGRGFTVGVDHYLRLQQLLSGLGEECGPEDLKTILCPIFAINQDQQRSFYRSFDDYFALFLPVSAERGAKPAQEPGQPSEAPPSVSAREWPYVIAACVLVAATLTWSFFKWRTRSPAVAGPVVTTQSAPMGTVDVWTTPPGATVLADGDIVGGHTPTFFGLAPGPHTLVISLSGYRPVRDQVTVSENEITPVNIDLTPSSAPTQKPVLPAPGWDYSVIPVVAVPLILLALYEGYRYSNRKFVLQKRRIKKPPYSWPLKLEVFAPDIFESAQFYSAARRLQRRQTGEACHLDVEASVCATIDSLGYPQLQYKPNSKVPEYLVLIDRYSFRDHQAQLLRCLVARLRSEGVFVTSYYFESDPRVCFSDDGAATVYLSDLQTRYSQDRLIILGDGDQLIDPVHGKLVSWSALFRHWNDRAVLTPEVPARWSLREKALASQFIVLPATSEGFLALVDHFELAAPTDLRSWRKSAPDLAPPDADSAKLVEEFRRYLGEGTFQWLCACAVYPELQWDLTLHLGSLPCLGENLIQEANLVKLVRLPWFRKGSVPDRLRSLLIQELKPDQERAVREAIINVLEKNPAPQETHASDAQSLEIAIQRYSLNPRNHRARRNLIDAIERSPEGLVARDFTLLSSLESTSRSPLDFLLPRALRSVLYPDGLSAFGARTGARIVLTFAVIFVGLVVVAKSHKQQQETVLSTPSQEESSQLQNALPSQPTLLGYITAVDVSNVIIDMGSDFGIQPGVQLAVYKLANPDTQVGVLEVIEVIDSQKARARIVTMNSGVKPEPSDVVKIGAGVITGKAGHLTVSANVDGARIFVDGQSKASWLTPYTFPDLSAGAHFVVISMHGYDKFERVVTVVSGRTSKVVGKLSTPVPPRAELDIVTNPPGVEVLIDGESYGPSPVRAMLLPGHHTYTAKAREGAPLENSITLKSGGIVTKTLTFPSVGGRSSPNGELNVFTKPSGAEVLVDGKSYGPSPVHVTLSAGTHSFTVKQAGAPPYERSVTLRSGEIMTKTLTMGNAQSTGIVEVRTIPPGATVAVDGFRSVIDEQTPTSIRLPVGPHTLAITLAGYRLVQKQVMVSEHVTTSVSITLANQ